MSAVTLRNGATHTGGHTTVSVTREQVDQALAQVARTYPELERCMAVATAMLCRLDTIRSEAKLSASVLRRSCEALPTASTHVADLLGILGSWGEVHELYIREAQ